MKLHVKSAAIAEKTWRMLALRVRWTLTRISAARSDGRTRIYAWRGGHVSISRSFYSQQQYSSNTIHSAVSLSSAEHLLAIWHSRLYRPIPPPALLDPRWVELIYSSSWIAF